MYAAMARLAVFRAMLLCALLAVAGRAHAQHEVRALVRFENPKTGEPLTAPVAADTLRIIDAGQPAQSVRISPAEDLPLSIVLAFDVSGSGRNSMHALRNSVSALLQQLVRAGKDSVTLVDFNDEIYLDAGPTDDVEKVSRQLSRLDNYRGGTALFDAIIAICARAYGKSIAPPERRILLLFTDGVDNASHSDLKSAVAVAQDAGVAIFAISPADPDPIRGKAFKAVLQPLTKSTGGRLFAAKDPRRLEQLFGVLGRVLTAQFLLTYTLADPQPARHRSVDIVSRTGDVVAYVPLKSNQP